MNNSILILILLALVSCLSKRGNVQNEKYSEVILYNKLNTIVIKSKIQSFNTTYGCYELVVQDTLERKYKLLTVKKNVEIQENNFNENEYYEFEIKQLTHLNLKDETLVLNGDTIIFAPTQKIRHCIFYNKEQFCSSHEYEVYELLKINVMKP